MSQEQSPATYREAFTHEEALAFAELWKDTPTHSPNPGGLFGKLARYILASVPSEIADSGALADILMASLKEAGHVIGLATALHVVNAMRFRTIPSAIARMEWVPVEDREAVARIRDNIGREVNPADGIYAQAESGQWFRLDGVQQLPVGEPE